MVHVGGEPHTQFLIDAFTARFRQANNAVFISLNNPPFKFAASTKRLFLIHRDAVLGLPMSLEEALIRPDGKPHPPLQFVEGTAPPPTDFRTGFERKPEGTRPPSREVIIDDPRQTSDPNIILVEADI